jgi:hypothetical protein
VILKVFIENDNLDDSFEENFVSIDKTERNQKEKETISKELNMESIEITHTLNDIKGKINQKLMETK